MIESNGFVPLNFIFAACQPVGRLIKNVIMKKIAICIVFVLALTLVVKAQNKPASKQPVKTKPKSTVVSSPLKTLEDSANYAIGLSVANFYKQQGFAKINSALVARAINEAMGGKKLLLDEAQANNCMVNYMNREQAAKAKPFVAEGEKFLAENKKKPGIITTASGLQYEILTQGNGPKPTPTDTVVCNYKGSFLNGTVFDESYTRGKPIEFAVTGVIRGWTEILLLMPVGSKYKLYVPYQLGYGMNDYYSIPGGSMLTFELELVNIKGK